MTNPEVSELLKLPPRDWRGRFGRVVCVNGHDRCFYGPSLECPYCEVRGCSESKS